MKTQLGISVYPDIAPIEEIVDYFKLASQYDVDFVFTSMFSVEGNKEQVLNYFIKLIQEAHKYNLKVMLDVNPKCFATVEADYDNLETFHQIGADILRMDFSYGKEKNKVLIDNPYGIEIVFNASMEVIEGLKKSGVEEEKINACHNFYPQRYTAKKWDAFQEENKMFKEIAPGMKVGAFLSSNNRPSHGVWDAVVGLPTVEMMRDYPIDLQARLLLGTGNVDYLCIGNAYALASEFQALQEVLEVEEFNEETMGPLVKSLLEFLNSKTKPTVKKIRIDLNNEISNLEKEILFDFGPHIDVGDSSEWIWRTRLPRFKYNTSEYSIPCRKEETDYFQPGDVVIVNDHYAHYRGEVQIVRIPIINDGTRNLVGHISNDEFYLFQLVNDGDCIRFLQ